MFSSNLSKTNVSRYMYENKNDIPIIDTIKITNFLYGRLDIVINRYYNGRMEYLPLLMDFNNIVDPLKINIDSLIDIPDFDLMIQNLTDNQIFVDDKVPGVNSTMVNREVNDAQKKESNKTSTTALPKLNITLRKVQYNPDTGKITY